MIQNTKENLEKLDSYVTRAKENNLDMIDLINYFANFYGVNQKGKLSKEKEQIFEKMITPDKKIVCILIDGLGYYKVKQLHDGSILKRGLKTSLQTVNPTSTACVLSSIASASYPTEHGIFGWWQYSRKHHMNYYPLLFKDKTGEDLQNKKMKQKEIYHFTSIFEKYKYPVHIYMNRSIINSPFSKIFSGKHANCYGSYSIRDAFSRIARRVEEENQKAFYYLYIDGIDKTSHTYGTNSKEVQNILEEIEQGIVQIKKADKNTTVVVIADHGQVDMTSMIYLNQNHDYMKYFYALPSIDTRMISFFVKEECKEEFENTFCQEFQKDVILLKKEEIEEKRIFGNTAFSEYANNACGEYIGIIVNNKFMICNKLNLNDMMSTKGNHSGLTKEETTIPLIVI